MIFSTSAGRLVFNAYKNRPQLPEDVARANGHDDLAQYLQDVNVRLVDDHYCVYLTTHLGKCYFDCFLFIENCIFKLMVQVDVFDKVHFHVIAHVNIIFLLFSKFALSRYLFVNFKFYL